MSTNCSAVSCRQTKKMNVGTDFSRVAQNEIKQLTCTGGAREIFLVPMHADNSACVGQDGVRANNSLPISPNFSLISSMSTFSSISLS